mgnify:CR=1 FL=1
MQKVSLDFSQVLSLSSSFSYLVFLLFLSLPLSLPRFHLVYFRLCLPRLLLRVLRLTFTRILSFFRPRSSFIFRASEEKKEDETGRREKEQRGAELGSSSCTKWFSKYLGDHATRGVSRFSLSLVHSIFAFDHAPLTPVSSSLLHPPSSYLLLRGSFHSMEFQSRPWRGLATRASLFFARRGTPAQRKEGQ